MSSGLIAAVARQLTIVQTYNRTPVRVRMHPLDLDVMMRDFTPTDPAYHAREMIDTSARLFGAELVADDAVVRGNPEVDWR